MKVELKLTEEQIEALHTLFGEFCYSVTKSIMTLADIEGDAEVTNDAIFALYRQLDDVLEEEI